MIGRKRLSTTKTDQVLPKLTTLCLCQWLKKGRSLSGMRPFQQGLQDRDTRPIWERFSRLLRLYRTIGCTISGDQRKSNSSAGFIWGKYLVSEIWGGGE